MINFPAMTEEQRQQAIKDFTFRAVNTDCDVSLLAYQIAIAALSSTPASREIIQASLYANRPLYTDPPAPVLRVLDGWKLVPIEPTEDMLAAAKEWFGLTTTAEGVYEKMLDAAPEASNEQ